MANGYGFNSWVGFGAESTYGTPATRTQFLEINSESIAVADDVVETNSTYQFVKDADNFVQGRKMVGGAFDFDLRYQGAEKIFKQALGTSSYSAVGTAAAAGTLHTFWMAATLPTGLTVEVNRDVTAFVYHGCKIDTLDINGDNAGIVTVSANVIAEDEGTAAASTPVFSSSKMWTFAQCALTVGGGTRAVKSFKVSLNNNLQKDRFWLGARTVKEPLRSGRAEVSGDLTLEFQDTTDWTTFQSAGTGALSAVYSGDVINGTVVNKFQIDCPYIRFKSYAPQVKDSGVIEVTVPFEAYAQGTGSTTVPMRVQMVNLTNGTDA